MDIVAQIVEIHSSLDTAALPHAFGGALALAWCTNHARGTIDIDINVFVTTDRVDDVIEALPDNVSTPQSAIELLRRDGQVRLMWEHTPLDLFMNTTEFHQSAATRVRFERFAGVDVPFLSCSDLAVFKAFFNRSKDWVDLEEMVGANSVDMTVVIGTIVTYLGTDDPRVERLRTLVGQQRESR